MDFVQSRAQILYSEPRLHIKIIIIASKHKYQKQRKNYMTWKEPMLYGQQK